MSVIPTLFHHLRFEIIAIRGLLSVLGVIIMTFLASLGLLVNLDTPSQGLMSLTTFFDLIGVPAFFLVACFACGVVHSRHRQDHYLKTRPIVKWQLFLSKLILALLLVIGMTLTYAVAQLIIGTHVNWTSRSIPFLVSAFLALGLGLVMRDRVLSNVLIAGPVMLFMMTLSDSEHLVLPLFHTTTWEPGLGRILFVTMILVWGAICLGRLHVAGWLRLSFVALLALTVLLITPLVPTIRPSSPVSHAAEIPPTLLSPKTAINLINPGHKSERQTASVQLSGDSIPEDWFAVYLPREASDSSLVIPEPIVMSMWSEWFDQSLHTKILSVRKQYRTSSLHLLLSKKASGTPNFSLSGTVWLFRRVSEEAFRAASSLHQRTGDYAIHYTAQPEEQRARAQAMVSISHPTRHKVIMKLSDGDRWIAGFSTIHEGLIGAPPLFSTAGQTLTHRSMMDHHQLDAEVWEFVGRHPFQSKPVHVPLRSDSSDPGSALGVPIKSTLPDLR